MCCFILSNLVSYIMLNSKAKKEMSLKKQFECVSSLVGSRRGADTANTQLPFNLDLGTSKNNWLLEWSTEDEKNKMVPFKSWWHKQ